MAFLDNMNLNEVKVQENDWSLPNGTYPAMISDSKIMQSKAGKTLWQITYRVSEEIEQYGKRTVSEFFDIDPNADDMKKQFLKRRLVSLAFSDEDMATLEPGDIIGTDVTITVKNKQVNENNYTNVTKVVLGSTTPANSLSNY